MSTSCINVLWVIDHVCYDGSLHGGGRLYWNVVPRFDSGRFRIIPCLLRATPAIRQLFAESPVPVRILNKRKFDPTTLWTFLRLIKEENVHIMHLHCYAASSFGRLAGLFTGLPTIIHDYDTEVYFPYPWYLWMADRMLARVARYALAPSPMVRDFLLRKRKIDGGRIQMLLHAVPTEKYAPIPRERVSHMRARLGVGEEAPLVATVTKLGPQRGNEELLKAVAQVRQSHPGSVFLLVYKPAYYHRLPSQKYVQVSATDKEGIVSDLQKLINQLGIEKNVRLLEWPENVDELVSACDLVVAPFLSERFSSVNLLEAMAQGKPLIATDMGEQREIIQNGINGYLVTPGDVQELAARICELLADPAKRDRMSVQARRLSESYSVDAYTRRLQTLYAELASNGTGVRATTGRTAG